MVKFRQIFMKGISDLLHPYSFDARLGAATENLFYLDVSDILAREIQGFDNDIPYIYWGGFKYFNPVTISFYALHLYDRYLLKEENMLKESFLKQTTWLLTRINNQGGAFIYSYPAPLYMANIGWKSAMAQGLAISVFVRAFNLTREIMYYNAAIQAAEILSRPIEKGGCTSFCENGLPFLEEVAVIPAAHILNGAVFALLGLYDLERVSGAFKSFKELALQRLTIELSHYDIGYWSRYDLMYRTPASRGYHILHIAQLRILYRLSVEPIFQHYADMWQSYLHDPFKRMKAFGEKVWFFIKREELPRS